MTKPYFMALALEEEALPSSYSLTSLTTRSRGYLKGINESTSFETLPHPQGELARIAHSYLSSPVSDTPPSERLTERVLSIRLRLLGQLSLANSRRADREKAAFAFAKKEHTFFSGWEHTLDGGDLYQLGESEAWWKPGDFQRNDRELADIGPDPEKRRRAGFMQIPHAEYIKRTQHEIMQLLLMTRSEPLQRLAALTALYTASRGQREGMAKLTERLYRAMARDVARELEARGILVPMQPLYSLPREARAMSTFFISQSQAAKKLFVREDDNTIGTIDNEDFGAKVISRNGTRDQLSLLFFQHELVEKRRAVAPGEETFIELQIDETPGDDASALDALLRAIEQLDIDANTLEHLPRVCAGMFTAAQQDRELSFNWPGTFWDTDSGRRLCQTIGFDPDNKRHRKRVQNIRTLLETIVLHRQVRGQGPRGNKTRMKWSGPVIEARASQLQIEVEHRGGLSEHHDFRAWSIAKELWDMVIPESEGGAPSFMKLDERVFHLDGSSSIPFNLYWTLINRAYMGSYTSVEDDQVSEDGVFRPKLGTLHKWSGLEGRFSRPARLKSLLNETFELMKERGLITHWKCDALDPDSNLTMNELLAQRVEVGLSRRQLESLRSSTIALSEDSPSETN